MLGIILEIVHVASHRDRDTVFAKQPVDCGEVVARARLIMAERIEGMSQQDHDELATRGRERRLEPATLGGVDSPHDARVDGDQGELSV